jgi:hypothetical protein
VLTTASFTAAVSYFFQLVPRWLCRLPKPAKVQHRFVVRADINVISTSEACRRGFAAGIDKLADAVAITLGPKGGAWLASSMCLFLFLNLVIANYFWTSTAREVCSDRQS